MSEAYATLGHTNLCRRWMQYDLDVVHNVLLVNQRGPAPHNLLQAAKDAGGECLVYDVATPFLKRAADLRAYARQNADVVVLHTHADEILATVAFGVEGGPPVLLLNHADHAFWVGCSVADMVLDIRTSGQIWTKQVRGVERTSILPIPLLENKGAREQENTNSERKSAARRTLGIPETANVLLTVGSEFKYRPLPGLDFLSTVRKIIEKEDNTFLIAVGPYDAGAWQMAKKETAGRIRAFGQQPDTIVFCEAADIYLEGFPSGSLTALLEAGLTGLPCVRAPRDSQPPASSDGESLDLIPQPSDVSDYIRKAIALIEDPKGRVELGVALQRSIESVHCGKHWLARLQSIKPQIPKVHSIHPNFTPGSIEEKVRDWNFTVLHSGKQPRPRSEQVVSIFAETWERTCARPLVDRSLWKQLECRQQPGSKNLAKKNGYWMGMYLWRQNRKIRSQGTYAKLFSDARFAHKTGRYGMGRKLIYHSLLAKYSCIGDLRWLKLLVKLHLNQPMEAKVKRWMQTFRSYCLL